MVSVLRPETLAVLRTVRPLDPQFHNAMEAEAFEAAHTFGPFKVARATTGLYVLLDGRRKMGDQLAATEERLARADATAVRLCIRAGVPVAPELAAEIEARPMAEGGMRR